MCYSGTVGAATEAALNGIHTIAFSMGKASAVDVAEQNLPAMLEELLFAPLNPGELWNVNFPPCPAAECKGVLRGRFPEKHSFYENYYTCLREENGVQYLTPVPKEVLTREETQEGSDIHAVLNGYISIARCAAPRIKLPYKHKVPPKRSSLRRLFISAFCDRWTGPP